MPDAGHRTRIGMTGSKVTMTNRSVSLSWAQPHPIFVTFEKEPWKHTAGNYMGPRGDGIGDPLLWPQEKGPPGVTEWAGWSNLFNEGLVMDLGLMEEEVDYDQDDDLYLNTRRSSVPRFRRMWMATRYGGNSTPTWDIGFAWCDWLQEIEGMWASWRIDDAEAVDIALFRKDEPTYLCVAKQSAGVLSVAVLEGGVLDLDYFPGGAWSVHVVDPVGGDYDDDIALHPETAVDEDLDAPRPEPWTSLVRAINVGNGVLVVYLKGQVLRSVLVRRDGTNCTVTRGPDLDTNVIAVGQMIPEDWQLTEAASSVKIGLPYVRTGNETVFRLLTCTGTSVTLGGEFRKTGANWGVIAFAGDHVAAIYRVETDTRPGTPAIAQGPVHVAMLTPDLGTVVLDTTLGSAPYGPTTAIGFPDGRLLVRGINLRESTSVLPASIGSVDSLGSWQNSGWDTSVVSFDPSVGIRGGGSLKLVTSGIGGSGAAAGARWGPYGTKTIPVIGGEWHQIRAYFRAEGVPEETNRWGRVGFIWFDAGGTDLGSSSTGSEALTSAWQEVQDVVLAPDNAAYAQLEVVYQYPGNGESFWVDEITTATWSAVARLYNWNGSSLTLQDQIEPEEFWTHGVNTYKIHDDICFMSQGPGNYYGRAYFCGGAVKPGVAKAIGLENGWVVAHTWSGAHINAWHMEPGVGVASDGEGSPAWPDKLAGEVPGVTYWRAIQVDTSTGEILRAGRARERFFPFYWNDPYEGIRNEGSVDVHVRGQSFLSGYLGTLDVTEHLAATSLNKTNLRAKLSVMTVQDDGSIQETSTVMITPPHPFVSNGAEVKYVTPVSIDTLGDGRFILLLDVIDHPSGMWSTGPHNNEVWAMIVTVGADFSITQGPLTLLTTSADPENLWGQEGWATVKMTSPTTAVVVFAGAHIGLSENPTGFAALGVNGTTITVGEINLPNSLIFGYNGTQDGQPTVCGNTLINQFYYQDQWYHNSARWPGTENLFRPLLFALVTVRDDLTLDIRVEIGRVPPEVRPAFNPSFWGMYDNETGEAIPNGNWTRSDLLAISATDFLYSPWLHVETDDSLYASSWVSRWGIDPDGRVRYRPGEQWTYAKHNNWSGTNALKLARVGNVFAVFGGPGDVRDREPILSGLGGIGGGLRVLRPGGRGAASVTKHTLGLRARPMDAALSR